jgi:hypothetical protein
MVRVFSSERGGGGEGEVAGQRSRDDVGGWEGDGANGSEVEIGEEGQGGRGQRNELKGRNTCRGEVG